MSFEMLVALHVTDHARYADYRAAMTPILERYGGGFGYDLEVGRVLKPSTATHLNRVFTIHFPDEATKDAFFADEEYGGVKRAHFEGAVADTVIIASYER